MDSINKPFIEQRADPYVYRHTDGTYYFTASVPAYDRIILRRSNTLMGLKDASEVTVWKRHKSGKMSEHIWAPELHYLDGRWYLYFAAGRQKNIWKIRPYVLECMGQDPLRGPWVERGKIQRAKDDIYSFKAFPWMPRSLNTGGTGISYGRKKSVWVFRSRIYILPEWNHPSNWPRPRYCLPHPITIGRGRNLGK